MSISKLFCFQKLPTISESESTITAHTVQSSQVFFMKEVDSAPCFSKPCEYILKIISLEGRQINFNLLPVYPDVNQTGTVCPYRASHVVLSS